MRFLLKKEDNSVPPILLIFEEQLTQNHPQYLSGLSRSCMWTKMATKGCFGYDLISQEAKSPLSVSWTPFKAG